MPVLSALHLYPVKSCAGIALREATLTPAGLMREQIYDREWMVVDDHGDFLTQRECPAMARITPKLTADTLQLRAPGMLRLDIALDLPDPDRAPTLAVRVWDDVVTAYDCDETTATWFTKALGVRCRLVRFHPQARRTTSGKWTDGQKIPTLFSDGYPLLVIGEASLADLNAKLAAHGRAPLPMDRFRPNIVLRDAGAFEEDFAQSLAIGDAVLKPVKPCARCSIPAIDQASGVAGPDPLDILAGYRADPRVDGGITFGMNAIVQAGDGSRIRIGDHVGLQLAFGD